MNNADLFDLIEKLKASGVTHFKQGDLELTLAPTQQNLAPVMRLVPTSLEVLPGEPGTEPPHIVQQMKSLLKLSDEELVDQIFPLPKPIEHGTA